MTTLESIGLRLTEERVRLGLNQSDFAARVPVTRKTLYGYESGVRSPDALALSIWDSMGLDVLYVVTGRRSRAASSGVHVQQNFHPGVKIGQNAGHNIINRGARKK